MAVGGGGLVTSLIINGGLCVAFFLIFSLLRVGDITRRFYAPKRFDPEVKVKPRKLRMGLTSWIAPTLSYPEDEVMTVAGLDVVVLIRLMTYGTVLFAFVTVWCCALLMPINGTAGGLRAAGNTTATDLDLLSMSNVPNHRPGSDRFWAHLISVYVITIFALVLLFSFSKDVSKLRARFISTVPRTATTHTVLVTDIPGISRGTFSALVPNALEKAASSAASAVANTAASANRAVTNTMLSDTLAASPAGPAGDAQPAAPLPDAILDPWAAASDALKGGNVEDLVTNEMKATYGESHVGAVNVVYDTARIEPVVTKYDAAKGQLSDILDDYIGKLRRKVDIADKDRKKVTLLPALAPAWAKDKYKVGAAPVKVDALEYLPLEMENLKGQIKDLSAKASEAYVPAAFVTFNDRYTQTTAATGMHSYDELCWRVQAAPGGDEIIWGNLGIRHWQRVVRGLAMWGAFITLLIFYIPVVAAIQAVVSLENARKVPGLGKLVDLKIVADILQGILPSLVMKIFLAILPMILNMMNRFTGMVSISQVDFATVSKFFIFQVFALFIYSFVLGSALNQIAAILANPSNVVTLLGVGAPQQASFFCTYIMLSALGMGFRLLRPVGLILYIIKDKLAGTEKAKYRLWAKQNFTFGTHTANHTMTILLGLAYCCITPIIAPFCLLYFILGTLSEKYQMIYVLQHPYEAAGAMWMTIFHQIMVGIYFLQAIVATVLGVKRWPYAALILPLFVVTAVFHWFVTTVFRRPWTLTSIREAAALDARDGGKSVTPEEEAQLRQIYLNPAFKLNEAEHDELLANAKAVDAQLQGGGGDLKIKDVEIPATEASSHA